MPQLSHLSYTRTSVIQFIVLTLALETSRCHVLPQISQNAETLKSMDYRQLKMLKCGKNMVTRRGVKVSVSSPHMVEKYLKIFKPHIQEIN